MARRDDDDEDDNRLPKAPSGLRIYGPEDTEADAWARILLMGPAKGGKTTACLKTSPKTVFMINCDGKGALVGARQQGARDYYAVDVNSAEQWNKAVIFACKLATQEKISTIVVDPLTTLYDTILDDLKGSFSGFDLWANVLDYMVGGIRDLRSADAHLIVTSHSMANEDSMQGVLPAIGGKSATRIPAMMHDWIWLDVEVGKDYVDRRFLVGPQKNWNHGARNAKRSVAIDADVVLLLKELGIKP